MATCNPRRALTFIALIGVTMTLTACDDFDGNDAERLVNPRVSDATTFEGNDGTIEQQFTVTIDPGLMSVQLSVNTVDDTAIAGVDYVSITNGVLAIPEGATTATVSVDIIGDDEFEADEAFILRVSTLQGRPESAQGVGTITNDDLEREIQLRATYSYDALNRITSVTYDNGRSVEYTYDSAGNVMQVDVTTP